MTPGTMTFARAADPFNPLTPSSAASVSSVDAFIRCIRPDGRPQTGPYGRLGASSVDRFIR